MNTKILHKAAAAVKNVYVIPAPNLSAKGG